MTDEQKLRDEFEAWAMIWLDLEQCANGDYRQPDSDAAFDAWKASHAKYAPRWLPIDEAAKSGQLVDVWSPSIGRWTDCHYDRVAAAFRSHRLGALILYATHYMPTPDAPEESI